MIKIWNYFFYSTWQLHFAVGSYLIQESIFRFARHIPFMRKNLKKGRKEFHKVMHDLDTGMNLGLSFKAMLTSTMIVYTTVFLTLVIKLNINVKETLYYYCFLVLGLAYLTNYILLYKADVYKKYFVEFEKINNKSIVYFSAVFFHLGAIVFCLLLIYFTTGFKLK